MKIDGLILTDEKGNKYRIVRLSKEDEPEKRELELAKWLKSQRKKMGLTQVQLAERAGMLQPNICAYETGKRKPNDASLNILKAIFSGAS